MGLIPGFEHIALDPAMLASLQNTLGPAGVMTPVEVAIQRLMDEAERDRAALSTNLAARTQAASEAAATAGSAYQSAAAAPPPQLDPLAATLPQFAGNLASIITQDKSYSVRAHENLKGAQDDLIRARMDNLTALKDSFDRKASAAESIGNIELAETSRMKSEQLAKSLQVLLAQKSEDAAKERLTTQEQGDTERTRMNNQTQIEVARINAGARAAQSAKDTVDFMDTLVEEIPRGDGSGETLRYVNLTNVQNDKKTKNQAISYARALGIPALDRNTVDRFKTVEEVYSSMDEIDAVMSQFLPKTEGMSGNRTAVTRIKSAGKNILANKFQSNADIAAFNSTSIVGIRAIQALAAGAGSGFRLNEAEVRMMQARWPKITDTYEKALKNLQWERSFLDKKVNSFFPRKQSNPGAAEDEASAYRKGG